MLAAWAFANEHAPAIYGAISLCVALISLASAKRGLMLAAALLFADWLTWNGTQIVWGDNYASLLLPTEDAMYLGFMVWTWQAAGRLPSLALVSYLFLVAIVAWVVFILSGRQTSFTCLLTANGIFFAQEAIIGVAGAWWAIRAGMAGRASGGDLRAPRGGYANGLHVVGGSPKPEEL